MSVKSSFWLLLGVFIVGIFKVAGQQNSVYSRYLDVSFANGSTVAQIAGPVTDVDCSLQCETQKTCTAVQYVYSNMSCTLLTNAACGIYFINATNSMVLSKSEHSINLRLNYIKRNDFSD